MFFLYICIIPIYYTAADEENEKFRLTIRGSIERESFQNERDKLYECGLYYIQRTPFSLFLASEIQAAPCSLSYPVSRLSSSSRRHSPLYGVYYVYLLRLLRRALCVGWLLWMGQRVYNMIKLAEIYCIIRRFFLSAIERWATLLTLLRE